MSPHELHLDWKNKINVMKSSTETLATALRILANDIQSPDNVPALCLMEAADRLEELEGTIVGLRNELGWRTLERDEALSKLKRAINDLSKLTSMIIELDKQVNGMAQCPKCVDDGTQDCAT